MNVFNEHPSNFLLGLSTVSRKCHKDLILATIINACRDVLAKAHVSPGPGYVSGDQQMSLRFRYDPPSLQTNKGHCTLKRPGARLSTSFPITAHNHPNIPCLTTS
jgi:hypothetical protein